MVLNLPLFSQASAERDAYAICATIIAFEYFLHFSAEVDLFWKAPWTVPKCLFLWSRYYSLLFNVSTAVLFLLPDPSLQLCSWFFHWQTTGSIHVLTTHVILEFRLYAMYGNPRWILYFFLALTTGECAGMIAVFAYRDSVTLGINEPTHGLHVCADAKNVFRGLHWYVYYWLAVLVVEGVLLLLALRKAWLHRPVPIRNPGSLMQRLTKGSVQYFLTIFWIYLINLIFYACHLATLNQIGTAFAYALSCILANRMLIGIRAEAYADSLESYADHTGIEFNHPSSRQSCESSGSVIDIRRFHSDPAHA